MNKTTIIALIALLSLLTIVTAVKVNYSNERTNIEPLYYGYKCDITRPATEYRPAKTWYGIGILGRLSNGEITCFLPNHKTHKETVTTPICTPTTKTVCEETTVCEQECHWKLRCNHHCHKWSNWHWHKECHEECHNETNCHEETTTC